MRDLTLMDSMATGDSFMPTNTTTDFDDNASTFEALDTSRGPPASITRSKSPPAKTPSSQEVFYEDYRNDRAAGGGINTQGYQGEQQFGRNKGPKSPVSARVSLSNGIADLPEESLPSDNALLSALMENPRKALPGSRCPFPLNA